MERTNIETRMQLTAGLFIRPPGETVGYLNLGDLNGHKRAVTRNGTPIEQQEKGFHRLISNNTALVGNLWEFNLREQFKLNAPMLFAAVVNSAAIGYGAVAAPTGTASFNAVKQGYSYMIVSGLIPIAQLNTVVVTVSAVVRTEGVDYTIDTGNGELYIIPGGGIADAANVAVTFGVTPLQLWDVWATSNAGTPSGALTDAGRKIGAVKLYQFDQHAAAGVQRRLWSFTGQYWVEGDDTQDGAKPSELMLKVLAIDKPTVQILK
jgi:hypothetical protein